MTNRLAISIVICFLVLSGCPESEQSGGIIGFDGDLSTSDDGFVMDGEIENEAPGEAPVFSNVTVYFFRNNGTVIESRKINKLGRRANMSIELDEVPKYVVIHSPEFWEYNDIDVSYYTYRDDVFGEKTIGSKDEFPVQVPG